MKRKNKNYFSLIPNIFYRSFDDVFNYNLLNDDSFGNDFEKHTSENEGKLEITTGENENGKWERKEWTSNDGLTRMSSYTLTSSNFGKSITNQEDLKKQLKEAVGNEDYELAAKLKKQIDGL